MRRTVFTKAFLAACLLTFALAGSSVAAASSIDSMMAMFRDKAESSRTTLAASPEDLEAQKQLAESLRYMGLLIPGNSEAFGFLRESCAVYIKLEPKLSASGLQGGAAESAAVLLYRDRSVEENQRMAESIFQMLRRVPAEPESEIARNWLASSLAQATQDPKQRAELFAEAQKNLRAYIASNPARRESAQRTLANSLIWQAGLSSDAAMKKAHYAEAEALLTPAKEASEKSARDMFIDKVLLWQFQARDAKDAATRDTLLAKVEQVVQATLKDDSQPGNQSACYTMQAASVAVKGDAASSLALIKKGMESDPERKERYETFVRNTPLYDSVRNDPDFAQYMASLRGSNSTPVPQAQK